MTIEQNTPQVCGISIDKWKLPEFKKRLKKAGFTQIEKVPFGQNVIVLKVTTTETLKLQKLVENTQRALNNRKR